MFKDMDSVCSCFSGSEVLNILLFIPSGYMVLLGFTGLTAGKC